jgi:hypothetical protein
MDFKKTHASSEVPSLPRQAELPLPPFERIDAALDSGQGFGSLDEHPAHPPDRDMHLKQ